MAGETRADAFLAMNPNGKVPVAALPGGRYLAESNAILWYLASSSDLAGARAKSGRARGNAQEVLERSTESRHNAGMRV